MLYQFLSIAFYVILYLICIGFAVGFIYLFVVGGMASGVLATGTPEEKQASMPPTKEVIASQSRITSGFKIAEKLAERAAAKVAENGPRYPSHVYRVMSEEAVNVALKARGEWPPFYNAHDALGHLAEEIRELEGHVFTKEKNRDLVAMKKEALDVAACAIAMAVEICNEERGRR